MRIVIAGGHGQIALRLEPLLAARGYEVAGIIRDPEQGGDLRAAGAEPVLCDLESASVEHVAGILQGADVAVFAAGAGPGSGAERKDTVDRAAAVLFADAAERARVRRFLMVSSMGADSRHDGGEVFDFYLRAKGEADDHLRTRLGLEWTILRPGALTDDAGTGLVRLEARARRGPGPPGDVGGGGGERVDTP
ncbi:NAD(P)H-binding protein, partial [Streptomyces lavendulae]|uniref:NAD(P)H-binding protein n=1 Tax=Streptomyces lavendulae TaxID=1914 RepID=UPI0036B3879A